MFRSLHGMLPAVNPCPRMTSDTSVGFTLLFSNNDLMTVVPSDDALCELRLPFKEPIGVLCAATITMSSTVQQPLAIAMTMKIKPSH